MEVTQEMEDKKLVYEVPEVITYTAEEILEELGPAHADFDPNYGATGQTS